MNEKPGQGVVAEAIKDYMAWEVPEKGLDRLESTRAGWLLFSVIVKYTETPK